MSDSNERAPTVISSDVHVLDEINRVDQLHEKCQIIRRRIGEAKIEGVSPLALIEEMKIAGSALKQAQLHLKTLRELTNEAHDQSGVQEANTKPQTAVTPARFVVRNSGGGASSENDIVIDMAVESVEWDQYVSAHPRASPYHKSCWRSVFDESFAHSSYYIGARGPDKALVGVLPLVHLSSRLFGSFLVSLPYVSYGGPLGDSDMVDAIMLNHASKLAKDLRCSHLEIRECSAREGWPARTDKVAMTLRLPGDFDTLERGFGAKLRSQTRRALKEPVDVVVGGRELLDDFYRVFAQNMRDLGTPVYSRKFFVNIFNHLGAEAFIVIIRLKKQPVAAALLVGCGDTLEIPWASSLRRYNRLGVNMLLYRQVLKEAISRNYEHFDFGRSTRDSATYRFKRQWGAEAQQLHWHYWLESGGEPPMMNPHNPRYKFAIEVWRRLPVFVANRVGPPIVRNLP